MIKKYKKAKKEKLNVAMFKEVANAKRFNHRLLELL